MVHQADCDLLPGDLRCLESFVTDAFQNWIIKLGVALIWFDMFDWNDEEVTLPSLLLRNLRRFCIRLCVLMTSVLFLSLLSMKVADMHLWSSILGKD